MNMVMCFVEVKFDIEIKIDVVEVDDDYNVEFENESVRLYFLFDYYYLVFVLF